MSSALAAVLLAHDDPAKVRRLIAALDGVEIFLHCDRRAPDELVRRMLEGSGPNVHLVPRRRTSLASWSLVEAEFATLQLALERSRAEHVVVLSGSCYPLVQVAELEEELSEWRGLSRLLLHPLPFQQWDTPRNRDGGLWRFRRRFVSFRGKQLFVRGVPLRSVRRPIPRELRLHASSQWKIYARHHAATLLRILAERPDLLRFWRTTFVPDESCAASVLRSPALAGSIVDEVCDDFPWYIDWDSVARTFRPAWLAERDFPALRAARLAPPRRRDQALAGAADRNNCRKLFARKVSSRAERLLDLIDRELRTHP
jgi:Core-2/I-Branching enzyme